MQPSTLKPVLFAALATGGLWSALSQAESPRLALFYAIHVHAPELEGSKLDTRLARQDPQTARFLASGLEALASTLEEHGARASFQLTQAALGAVCGDVGPQVLHDLVAAGHDVGVHGHDAAEMVQAASRLQIECGLVARTGSGLLGPGMMMGGGRRGARGFLLDPDLFVQGAQSAQSAGLEVLTLNTTQTATREPALSQICGGQLGANPAGAPDSGVLPLAWRPALDQGEICGTGGEGLALLDHTPGDWLLDERGAPRASVAELADADFAQLKPLLTAALTAPGADGQTTSWGFVSHLHEYMPGAVEMGPVSPDALAALDRWLRWSTDVSEGTAVWKTPPDIVDGGL